MKLKATVQNGEENNLKKLLCILDSLDTGGAETFIMKLYRGIDKAKYQFDFVVCKDGYYDSEVQSMCGVIHTIPLRRKHPIKSFCALRRVVKNNKYKYVLKLGTSPIIAVDLIATRCGGAKRISVRSCNAVTNERIFSKIVNSLLRPIMNQVATVKIAPSDLAAKYTFGKKRAKNGDVKYLHNAVDLSIFKYDADKRSEIRKELGVEDRVVVGHIGRFNTQKNHAFLLDVFAKIKEKEPRAVLVLVGKGDLEGDIKEKIKSLGLFGSVIFTGVRSDVPALLSAMDVFVFPSFYEGMPNTVIEAQATGLPCVIADTITREADITGLVKYLSLGETADSWADTALSSISDERADTKQNFIDNKYDIDSTVSYFTELVFGLEH